MPGGRPTSLTPEVQARIIALVRAGNFRAIAMRACGVSKNCIRNWEIAAEAGEEPYTTFVAELHIAEAESQAELVARILACDNVKGASHLINMLERRHREWCLSINQHKRETEDAILAKLRANPKLHAEVAHVLAAEEDPAAGTDRPSH